VTPTASCNRTAHPRLTKCVRESPNFYTSGLIFYNLSVLLDAFVTQREFPVGLSSLATGIFFIAAGIAGLVAGYLMDRIDGRLVIIGSAIIGSCALGSVGFLRES
jgi:MFS family permease